MKKQTLITLTLAILSSSLTHAKVVYVNKNASGPTHDGASWATACLTVQAGVDAADNGDEVWVARSAPAGNAYVESVSLDERVALYGGFAGTETARSQRNWQTNVTVIESPSTSANVVSASSESAHVNGFSLRNGSNGVWVGGTATVTNCSISGNHSGVYVGTGKVTLTNSTLIGNRLEGICVFYGTTFVANCTITGSDYGISMTASTGKVANCTISGNAQGVVVPEDCILSINNSIIAFNGTGISVYRSDVTLTYNDVYGNVYSNYLGTTDRTKQDGNVSVDPLLSNPYYDIHIQPDSPCRNTGNNALVLAGWTDIDGQARVQDDQVDIGSDESDGTTWTVVTRTWYVKQTGDDGNDGLSWAKAKKSINSTLSVMRGFDEVWVAKGVYTENVTIPVGVALYGGFLGTETKRNQRNWAKNVTLINSTNSSLDVVESRLNGILDGFYVQNGATGVRAFGAITVANCAVRGNNVGLYGWGITTAENCTISGNSYEGIIANGTTTVSNCTICGNANGGVSVYEGTSLLVNCTICENGYYGIYVLTSGTTVSNSIIAFNGYGIGNDKTEVSVTLSTNDVYGNTINDYPNYTTNPTGENGNISLDPLLSNLYHDIHIQPGSPCRDAGNDSMVQAGWTDIDGQARIQGAHVDIGSDESDGTAWTVPVHRWYVKPTGDDGNDGLSWARAKKSLSSALTVAQGLDEIWVCAGVYTENITIPAGLSVYGGFSGTEANRSERDWKSNVTVVQSPSRTFDVITSGFRKVILDGFHVRNGRKGVNVRVGPATLANCSISANVDHGVHVCDGVVTLANCIVNGNGNYGVLGEFSLLTVTNCTISANSDVGVHSSFCITTLNNCTIAACNAGVSLTGQGELWAMNCIIAMNEIGFRVYDPIYIFTALSCNNVFGNTTANYLDHPDPTDDGGNISKDPLFVNRTGQNFRLLPGSPCVDAGADSVVTAGQLDLDGKPRILGAHVDIGAYEFSAALPPYSLSEAIAALKAGAGLLIIPVEDRSRTDVDTDGRITIRDAARIARKVAGREANP